MILLEITAIHILQVMVIVGDHIFCQNQYTSINIQYLQNLKSRNSHFDLSGMQDLTEMFIVKNLICLFSFRSMMSTIPFPDNNKDL